METPTEITCRTCGTMALPEAYFCANCGHQLREKPPATSWQAQGKAYAVSFFLPPFGLWSAWKYLKQPDRTSRAVGIVCVALTVASLWATIWYTQQLIASLNRQINEINISNF